jgi:hypothetical protein
VPGHAYPTRLGRCGRDDACRRWLAEARQGATGRSLIRGRYDLGVALLDEGDVSEIDASGMNTHQTAKQ